MIPQEAIEAAAKEVYRTSGRYRVMPYSEAREACESEALRILEAAAPFLRAQALDDAADEFYSRLPDGTGNGRAYNSYRVAELLRARAATERGEG